MASKVDLDLLCRTRHIEMTDELADYVDRNEGDPAKVVLTVRRVLETHYRRSRGYFEPNQNLGSIARTIASEGPSHPFYRDLIQLDRCNNATCDDHHGENANTGRTRTLSEEEIRVVARDALELIGARRPTAANQTSIGGGNGGARPSPSITLL